MGDLKLFNIGKKAVQELDGKAVGLDRSLQVIFEKNLEMLLGVLFFANDKHMVILHRLY